MENKHTISDLREMQSLPLSAKIRMTEYRIRQWIDEYGEDGVYVSFSGGKDSTVLLDIVRKIYPRVKAVFIDTGLEYPKIREFVKTFDNVDIIRPKMNFRQVLIEYGYPVIGKRVAGYVSSAKRNPDCMRAKWIRGDEKCKFVQNGKWAFLIQSPFKISDYCCTAMKKSPFHKYAKETKRNPIMATMAQESMQREEDWLKHGCNVFDRKEPASRPMSFWTENDVLQYIHENNLQIAKPYGQVIVKGTENGQICIQDMIGDYEGCQFCTTGCKRTGCIFCGFGITQDKERFVRLKEQEPKLADYVLRGGNLQKMECGSHQAAVWAFGLYWNGLMRTVICILGYQIKNITYGNTET